MQAPSESLEVSLARIGASDALNGGIISLKCTCDCGWRKNIQGWLLLSPDPLLRPLGMVGIRANRTLSSVRATIAYITGEIEFASQPIN